MTNILNNITQYFYTSHNIIFIEYYSINEYYIKHNELDLNKYYLQLNITKKEYGNSLHYAVFHNNFKKVIYLINNGFNINSKTSCKRTALHIAISKNQLNMIQYLLKHDTKLDISRGGDNILNVNVFDIYGLTPLMLAIMYGDIDVITLLIKYGADILAPNLLELSALKLAQQLEKEQYDKYNNIVRYLTKHYNAIIEFNNF